MNAKPSDGLGLLVIGKPKTKGEDYSPDESESSDEKTLAAEGILRAVKRNDAAALSRALEQHYECCMGDMDEESDPNETEPDDDVDD